LNPCPGASGRHYPYWGYLKAATTGGARDEPILENGKNLGTGLLLMKKIRYWQQPWSLLNSAVGNWLHVSQTTPTLQYPNLPFTVFCVGKGW